MHVDLDSLHLYTSIVLLSLVFVMDSSQPTPCDQGKVQCGQPFTLESCESDSSGITWAFARMHMTAVSMMLSFDHHLRPLVLQICIHRIFGDRLTLMSCVCRNKGCRCTFTMFTYTQARALRAMAQSHSICLKSHCDFGFCPRPVHNRDTNMQVTVPKYTISVVSMMQQAAMRIMMVQVHWHGSRRHGCSHH